MYTFVKKGDNLRPKLVMREREREIESTENFRDQLRYFPQPYPSSVNIDDFPWPCFDYAIPGFS